MLRRGTVQPPGGAPLWSPPGGWTLLKCVLGGVLLSRTLAGAVPSALSGLASGFGMDTGRFPVAVTTETTTWAVLDRHLWCGYSVIRVTACRPAPTHARGVVRVLVVGLGVDRIVDARVYRYRSPPGTPTHTKCVVGGVVVCVGLLVPVSSQTVTGLPLLAYQPSSLLGAYQNTEGVLWRPYLEDGFPLRCFQRLPFPNVANQPCPGRDNWHTRGSSVPVLSY